MTSNVSKEVIDNIRALKIDFELLIFNDTVESVVKASKLAKVPTKHIVKTLLFKTLGSNYFVVLVRGDRKVDTVKLGKYVGSGVVLASDREVLEVLGVEPGAVSPFLKSVLNLRKLVDPKILEEECVVCGGGTLNTLIKVRVKDLLKFLESYEIVDVF